MHYYYIDEIGRGHIVENEGDENYLAASTDKKDSFTGGYITVNSDRFNNGIVEVNNYAFFLNMLINPLVLWYTFIHGRNFCFG